MRFDISINGDEALDKALAQLMPKLEKKVIRQALRKAAAPILRQARANISAIRVTGQDTDPLRRGMKIRALRRKRGRFGVAVQTPTREELGIPPSSRWYYPAHIELGTKKAPARPYLRGALESKRPEATATIRREIVAGIEREAKRG